MKNWGQKNKLLDDEWETQDELYDNLCSKYNIHPNLDVACTWANSKCVAGCHWDSETDGLEEEWDLSEFKNEIK